MDIRRLLLVFPVIAIDGLHNGLGRLGIHLGILLEVGQEMVLQGSFIDPVFAEICGKRIVMGIGEGVGGIVNQLAQGVIIKKTELVLFLQSLGDPAHEAAGVPVIMSPEPLKADGTFQICSRISVRLNAAQQKCPLVPLGNLFHIVLNQIFSKTAVAFSSHGTAPFRDIFFDYSTFIPEKCEQRKKSEIRIIIPGKPEAVFVENNKVAPKGQCSENGSSTRQEPEKGVSECRGEYWKDFQRIGRSFLRMVALYTFFCYGIKEDKRN